MRRTLVVLLSLAWLVSCAGDAPKERTRPAAGPASDEEALASEMLEEYTSHMNALLDELERIAPLEDAEGDSTGETGLSEVQDIRAAIEAHLERVEESVEAAPSASPERPGPPARRAEGPSDEEIARLRREAAAAGDARAQVQRMTGEKAQLQRSLNETQEELDTLRARAKELEVLSQAYVIALPKGGLAAMRKKDHLRRRGITPLTYEPTAQILPIGATGKTIVEVDPTAKAIFLGSRVSGARVVSAHRHYDELFSIARRKGQLAVVIKSPSMFWKVSRYLIVEVE